MTNESTHEVSLPPIGIPLICKDYKYLINVIPWKSFTDFSFRAPKTWTMRPGDIVMLVKIEFFKPARQDTHDQWKLTFLHGDYPKEYLWNSHVLFVPGDDDNIKLRKWTDYWEILQPKR